MFGFQLGEFRLCAIGLTSDSGRCPAILIGEFALNHQDRHKQKEQRYVMALKSGQQLRLPRNEDKENTSKDEVLGCSLSSLCVSLSRTCVLNKATRGRTVDGMQ